MISLFLQNSEYNSAVAMSIVPIDFKVDDIDRVALVSRIRLSLNMCKKWLWKKFLGLSEPPFADSQHGVQRLLKREPFPYWKRQATLDDGANIRP